MSAHTEIVEEIGVSRSVPAEPVRMGRRARGSRTWALVRRPLFLFLICAAIITTVAGEAYSGAAACQFAIRRAMGGVGFDFVGWELNALGQKGTRSSTGPAQP